jgi:hypothetical protein
VHGRLTSTTTLLVGAWLAACSQAPPPEPTLRTPVTTSLEALEADSVADVLIQHLLRSEALLEESDSLFAPGAIVIADGEGRLSVPRLAGVGIGGRIQVVTSQVSTRGAFVWGVLEYRWLPVFESDAVRGGVATVVIARLLDGAWRIVHLHSSAPVIERPEMSRPVPSDSLDGTGRGEGPG